MKKLCALLLVCVLIVGMGIILFKVKFRPDSSPISADDISTSSLIASRPTSSHKTPYTMAPENLEEGSGMYSQFYFAPTEETLQISGSLWESGTPDGAARKVKILLFQAGLDDNIDSFTTDEFSRTTDVSHTFQSLDPNAYYYFRIDNLTGNSLFTDRFVDGVIEIR